MATCSRQSVCFIRTAFRRAHCRVSPQAASQLRQYAIQTKHQAPPATAGIDRIRNIGIIAHIDAGKTTTTERMLYYVGFTKRIGEVDQGSTVTDFLKPERERGITITSACIPFSWQQHRINLIDTPGHVDFTIEVERSMRVLDGAVCVLDAVAGVEAQTETVWRQANRYGVPRIAFVNKMDRLGASLGRTFASMERRLTGWGRPLLCQWPVVPDEASGVSGPGSGGPDFGGVVDVVTMEVLSWDAEKSGSVITRRKLLQDGPDGQRLYQEALNTRTALVEALSDLDEKIVDAFIECDGDHMQISADDINEALRRVTVSGKGVPVFCGASFKNIGVQPVLDAVVRFLPSPLERPAPTALTADGKEVTVNLADKEPCALAFKIMHDAKRGPLVFVRVYSGRITPQAFDSNRGMSVITSKSKTKERVSKVLQMYADDYEEIPEVTPGNIAALSGLKETSTGDTLLNGWNKRVFSLDTITIPPPVFVRSCEPQTSADERALNAALKAMVREDPSLHVTYDEETGQTLLSGMGELHLEITADRLQEVHRVNCKMGKVLISYRETMLLDPAAGESVTETYIHDRASFGQKAKAGVTLQIEPIIPLNSAEDELINTKEGAGGNEVHCKLGKLQFNIEGADDEKKGAMAGLTGYGPIGEMEDAIRSGIDGALGRGTLLGFPLTNLRVTCTEVHLFGPEVFAPSALRAAANRCVQAALKAVDNSRLLEPIMDVSVRVPERYVGAITKDISGTRRGQITSLGNDAESEGEDSAGDYAYRTVEASVPLSQLVGYSTALRGLTAGTGDFTMNLKGYGVMPSDRQGETIKEIRGF
ncbi:P-loop containing nucleoside triphosphate hydrolase protein [Fimicolochytrium jonesii]|uniref:P-loop containing nucleoside triphosphate hydrolase protein n=1 Tax=Fimicolochytrium jonesii TaxID=1396493 RepID=UPI0022FE2421|nr:P-loop containing nucleoside triphosphate hydrolase protein [Fimicolochytrium jonesii]KAI8823115.1 P-loop containing nucleoside triphosphate hydrolase protein [Fimicolochytrium jonesii]